MALTFIHRGIYDCSSIKIKFQQKYIIQMYRSPYSLTLGAIAKATQQHPV